jgi:hypothetical protein
MSDLGARDSLMSWLLQLLLICAPMAAQAGAGVALPG